jgi:hypothetical protein
LPPQSNSLQHPLHHLGLKIENVKDEGWQLVNRGKGYMYLRNVARTPDGIIKFWMGHAGKDMTVLYDQGPTWLKLHRGEAKRAGIGFALLEKGKNNKL